MNATLGGSGTFPGSLDRIETDWSMVHEPAHVVLRYANAIQSHFNALIRNHHDAEEAAQNFFLWIRKARQMRAFLIADSLQRLVFKLFP